MASPNGRWKVGTSCWEGHRCQHYLESRHWCKKASGDLLKTHPPKKNPPFLFGSNQSCFGPGLDCEVLERTVGETLFFAFEEAGFQELKSLGLWVKSPIRWFSQCQAVSGVRGSTIDYQQIGPNKLTNKKNAFYGSVVMLMLLLLLLLLLLLHDLGSWVGAAWGEWSGVAMVWPWRGWETQGGLVGHFSFVWCLQVGNVKLNGFDLIWSCTRKIKNPGIYEGFHICSCISLIYKQHPGLVILLLTHCCAYAPEPSSRWLGRWCCMRCNEQQQLDSKKNCQVWRRKRRMLHSLVMSKSIYNNFHIHRYNQRIPWKWESQDWDCSTFSGYPILDSKCLGNYVWSTLLAFNLTCAVCHWDCALSGPVKRHY